jgi:chloride channel 7
MRVMEAVIVAAFSATLGFMMMYFLNDCKPLGDDPTNNPIQVRVMLVV